MFSMSPTLQNSLQSLYNQYRGPQMQAPQAGQFNPMQPLWMQGAGLNPQIQPISSPAMGPPLNFSNPPGMQTNPGVNPNILQILQMMMSGKPLATPAITPTGTPTTTPQTPQQQQQQAQQQVQQHLQNIGASSGGSAIGIGGR